MRKKFETGDVVRLKSGSPEMTVSGYRNLDKIGKDFSTVREETTQVLSEYYAGTELRRGIHDEKELELVRKNSKLNSL
jgi:uncharacterized protein YodC (DUF2158 family)